MYQLFLAGKSLADATLLKRLKGTSSLPVSKVVTLFWATLLKRLKGAAATDARNLRLGLGLGSLGSGGSYVQRFEAGPMYNVCTGVLCTYNIGMGHMHNICTMYVRRVLCTMLERSDVPHASWNVARAERNLARNSLCLRNLHLSPALLTK